VSLNAGLGLVISACVLYIGYLTYRSNKSAGKTAQKLDEAGVHEQKRRNDIAETDLMINTLRSAAHDAQDEVEELRGVVSEARAETAKARGEVRQLENAVVTALRNIDILKRVLDRNRIPIPDLPEVHFNGR
jgi:peptidoglycan hydrolase CwlO-like protein